MLCNVVVGLLMSVYYVRVDWALRLASLVCVKHEYNDETDAADPARLGKVATWQRNNIVLVRSVADKFEPRRV